MQPRRKTRFSRWPATWHSRVVRRRITPARPAASHSVSRRISRQLGAQRARIGAQGRSRAALDPMTEKPRWLCFKLLMSGLWQEESFNGNEGKQARRSLQANPRPISNCCDQWRSQWRGDDRSCGERVVGSIRRTALSLPDPTGRGLRNGNEWRGKGQVNPPSRFRSNGTVDRRNSCAGLPYRCRFSKSKPPYITAPRAAQNRTTDWMASRWV
jgi:hypothetical protein